MLQNIAPILSTNFKKMNDCVEEIIYLDEICSKFFI